MRLLTSSCEFLRPFCPVEMLMEETLLFGFPCQANADLQDRCRHWQLQAQTAAEEAAAAVRRAGGAEEGSGALMMQRDELVAQVEELMERVAVEEAGRKEAEELAEQEASSSRLGPL